MAIRLPLEFQENKFSNYDDELSALLLRDAGEVSTQHLTNTMRTARLSNEMDNDISRAGSELALIVPIQRRAALAVYMKRCLDILGAVFGLLLLSPLLLLTAILIKTTSKGPVFFKQSRIGIGGRPFTMYKFRSMVLDAPDLQNQLLEKNEAEGPVFKIRNDPRITAVGRFIRTYSIDELPQLLNILKGDMSLVGPRPPVLKEVLQYQPWQWRRLSVVPGLTCIWQTSGRSNIGFDEWMRMDLQYIDEWSLWMDIKLIFKTVVTVLKSDGAF